MKGSQVKRYVSEEEILAGEKVLKDVNFDRTRGAVTVGIGCKMVSVIVEERVQDGG